jgi:putative ABC transport system permease protein
MSLHYEVIRNELLKNSNIIDVTAGDFDKMTATSSRKGVDWHGKPDDFEPWIYTTYVQSNFLDVMNIPLLTGEPFSLSDSTYILINEEAARIMCLENPIGQFFYMNKGDQQPYTIKGVVKNFHFHLLNEKINPLVIIHHRQWSCDHACIKVLPGGAKSALETAKKIWEQYNPDYDFTYNFLDENFEYHYKTEIYMERLLSLFAIIAILISCLGLFGLIAFIAETKTKEIGIRKVFGASVANMVEMLSKEFLILVGIAVLIAFPIAYYGADRLLQNYAYRISISWWIFALAAVITIVLTLLTVGFQALKAAMANPVKSIQSGE